MGANSPGVEENQPAPAPVSTCAGCVGQACAGPSLGRTCVLGHQLEWAELSPLDTGEAEADVWACETCLGTLPAEHSEDAIIVDSHGWMCSECEIAFCQRCMPQAAGPGSVMDQAVPVALGWHLVETGCQNAMFWV